MSTILGIDRHGTLRAEPGEPHDSQSQTFKFAEKGSRQRNCHVYRYQYDRDLPTGIPVQHK